MASQLVKVMPRRLAPERMFSQFFQIDQCNFWCVRICPAYHDVLRIEAAVLVGGTVQTAKRLPDRGREGATCFLAQVGLLIQRAETAQFLCDEDAFLARCRPAFAMEDRRWGNDADFAQTNNVVVFATRGRTGEGGGQGTTRVVALPLDVVGDAAVRYRKHAAPAVATAIGFFDPCTCAFPPFGESARQRLLVGIVRVGCFHGLSIKLFFAERACLEAPMYPVILFWHGADGHFDPVVHPSGI